MVDDKVSFDFLCRQYGVWMNFIQRNLEHESLQKVGCLGSMLVGVGITRSDFFTFWRVVRFYLIVRCRAATMCWLSMLDDRKHGKTACQTLRCEPVNISSRSVWFPWCPPCCLDSWSYGAGAKFPTDTSAFAAVWPTARCSGRPAAEASVGLHSDVAWEMGSLNLGIGNKHCTGHRFNGFNVPPIPCVQSLEFRVIQRHGLVMPRTFRLFKLKSRRARSSKVIRLHGDILETVPFVKTHGCWFWRFIHLCDLCYMLNSANVGHIATNLWKWDDYCTGNAIIARPFCFQGSFLKELLRGRNVLEVPRQEWIQHHYFM